MTNISVESPSQVLNFESSPASPASRNHGNDYHYRGLVLVIIEVIVEHECASTCSNVNICNIQRLLFYLLSVEPVRPGLHGVFLRGSPQPHLPNSSQVGRTTHLTPCNFHRFRRTTNQRLAFKTVSECRPVLIVSRHVSMDMRIPFGDPSNLPFPFVQLSGISELVSAIGLSVSVCDSTYIQRRGAQCDAAAN